MSLAESLARFHAACYTWKDTGTLPPRLAVEGGRLVHGLRTQGNACLVVIEQVPEVHPKLVRGVHVEVEANGVGRDLSTTRTRSLIISYTLGSFSNFFTTEGCRRLMM